MTASPEGLCLRNLKTPNCQRITRPIKPFSKGTLIAKAKNFNVLPAILALRTGRKS